MAIVSAGVEHPEYAMDTTTQSLDHTLFHIIVVLLIPSYRFPLHTLINLAGTHGFATCVG